jgi:hypothetical protein
MGIHRRNWSGLGLGLWCLTPLSTICLSYIMAVRWWKLSTRRKPPTRHKSLTWTGFELTTSVVICTDCIGSCKSNYHMNMTTMAPNISKYNFFFSKLNQYMGGFDRILQNFTFFQKKLTAIIIIDCPPVCLHSRTCVWCYNLVATKFWRIKSTGRLKYTIWKNT